MVGLRRETSYQSTEEIAPGRIRLLRHGQRARRREVEDSVRRGGVPDHSLEVGEEPRGQADRPHRVDHDQLPQPSVTAEGSGPLNTPTPSAMTTRAGDRPRWMLPSAPRLVGPGLVSPAMTTGKFGVLRARSTRTEPAVPFPSRVMSAEVRMVCP